MKFLCVPCDSPMKLQTVTPPESGSLSVVYACPECGYEVALLTNAYETQVVQSLGVRIGPDRLRPDGAAASALSAMAGQPGASAEAGCPFTAMIARADQARRLTTADGISIRWTAAAEARLANIPEFVRPMA